MQPHHRINHTDVFYLIILTVTLASGAWGSVVVMALRYYSEGQGIDSRWCH